MQRQVLGDMQFRGPSNGWEWPSEKSPSFQPTSTGVILSASHGKAIEINGTGVHTRNGDSIELKFRLLQKEKGCLRFGFSSWSESAMVTMDFVHKQILLSTSDWTTPQPVGSVPFSMSNQTTHVLLIEKAEGSGKLLKNANIYVYLDGQKLLSLQNLNLLPEMGVAISVTETRLLIKRFVHKGMPSGIPEYLHVGGWQMPNKNSIDENLNSICRGLSKAAKEGVQLLVTPETSLTGLFPNSFVTRKPKPVADAEGKLIKFMHNLKDAPYLVAGLPIWQNVPGHRVKKTLYNASRVYDPDGQIVSTHAKIHSCEANFWHGYRLQEFDVYGVPICMHICHDGRYPDVWTLPVMFGARLILHPANSKKTIRTIDVFEEKAKSSTVTSHAFYIHVNGGGGSYLVGPYDNLISVSNECRRNTPSFPMMGEPQEGLFHSRIRIHDAFGYWPVRSFRASETIAEAYLSLYKSMGGQRYPSNI